MEKTFPLNPVMRSMRYIGEELTIEFIKKDRTVERRHYGPVPKEIAYQWYYKLTLRDALSYYAKNIRKKFKLLNIEILKQP